MQEDNAVVSGFIEEVLNQGKIEDARRFFWDDMVELAPFPGQTPGISGLKQVLRDVRAAFPDTHQGAFLGVPATGRPVVVWGKVIDRVIGGKIKDTRIIMDTLGLMMQLGALPPPKP